MWVYYSGNKLMECRDIYFVHSLYKIFDEIVVNAADHKHNDKKINETLTTTDREAGEISV
ncbi:DNA topoisomerase II top2-Penicillium chrysogenum [Penicillium cf. griseofulvum]|uniref:DNA topoisomerase (ATP-hydrolyzing) n=1 Tax=Penicillium cf. griseofulvum TaxID=2972120 RepID=A0A9W9T696_9EURO|nr:DNA topoisomerase II [Penicillium cf. griseofulvum]KAJ5422166.1 DNA topoisomerase II top2-Penicillium chrysogenum [Penicillium cf. griseofulvum]